MKDVLNQLKVSKLGGGYEVVVVDDGSTDGGGDIVAEMQKSNLAIKLIRQANAGQGEARNTGLDNAIGKYIYFVDADDVLVADTINNHIRHMFENGIDTLCIKTFSIDSSEMDNQVVIKQSTPLYSQPVSGVQYLQQTSLLRAGRAELWHFIHSRSIIAQYNLRFENLIAEDYMYNVNYMVYAKAVSISNVVTYVYVGYPNSTGRRYRPYNEVSELGFRQLASFDKFFLKHKKTLAINELEEVSKAYIDWVTFAYILWPMIREAISLRACKSVTSTLKSRGIYPIAKPSNIPGTQMRSSKILNALWHASRYYPLWATLVAIRHILSFRISKSRKSLR